MTSNSLIRENGHGVLFLVAAVVFLVASLVRPTLARAEGNVVDAGDGDESLTALSDSSGSSDGASTESVLTPQGYVSPRSVNGTPLTDYGTKNEGAITAWYSESYFEDYSGTSDKVVYHAEYTLTPDETSEVRFSHKYFTLNPNFGYGGEGFIDKTDPSSWPANLQSGLNIIEWTDDKVVLEYTFSASDLEWCIAHPTTYEFGIAPRADILKMPADIEANYFTYRYVMSQKDETTGDTVFTEDLTKPFLTDKKTVEIAEQIAPVSNGAVGSYTTDKVYLEPGQTGAVRVTLSRPVGVVTSGDCEVNCVVPSGMTYVTGSASATSSSGLAVTVDDSSGSPKVDFSGLPVGETVTLDYQVKAPAGATAYAEYDTVDTLTNLYQKNLVSSPYNSSLAGANVYDQSEYDTTTSSTFGLRLPVAVTFDSKGGNYTPGDQSKYTGDLVSTVTDPTKGGCTFDGWYYTDSTGAERKWDFSTPLTGDLLLVAHWNPVIPTPATPVETASGTGVETDGGVMPITSDATDLGILGAVAVAGIVTAGIGLARRRRSVR